MNIVKFWVPVVLMAALIWIGSSLPPGDIRLPRFPHADKVLHAVVFGFFSLTVSRALHRGHGHAPLKTALLSIAAASVYGAADEFHQSFTPGRMPDVWDWVADTTGACVAQSGHYAWMKSKLRGRRWRP